MTDWLTLSRRRLLTLVGLGALAEPAGAMATEAGAAAVTPSPEPEVWKHFFAIQRVWAYVDRHSVAPGETFNLMLSQGPTEPKRRVWVEFFRIGDGPPKLVWKSPPFETRAHPAGKTAAALGPGWPPAIADIDTRAWPPGCYSADVVEDVTGIRDIQVVQFIVTDPRRGGDILVRLGTNTYQAYNSWGGHSLYPSESDTLRGQMAAFDRPCGPAFFEYDAFLVAWLEGVARRRGWRVDYASNFDVHTRPGLLSRYPLVISASHDEYWSAEEFDAFERRIFREGKATAFFGANAAYYQVRYADLNRPPKGSDRGRQIVCYKTLADPITARVSPQEARRLATARFRDGARRPETMLLGGAYQSWFDPASDQKPAYRVATLDLPPFEGVGWSAGDLAAEVVGYEWDNRDPDGDGGRLHDPVRSLNAAIDPAAVKVLFRGRAVDTAGKPGLAEAVYYRSPAGARVFDAGAIRWSWGLGKPGFANPRFQQFNENLVAWLLSGRANARDPA